MKKQKLITSVIALALIGAMGIGATLAYLSDNDAAKNTFTVGKVEIDLVEPSWNPDDAQDLAPGTAVEKDPKIINTGKNAAYMMMHIVGMGDMRKVGFDADYDQTTWMLVDEYGMPVEVETNDLVDGYYVYLGTGDPADPVVVAGGKTTPLFEEVRYTWEATGANFEKYIIKGCIDETTGEDISHYEIWIKDAEGTENIDGEMYSKAVEETFATYNAAEDYIISENGLNAKEESTYEFDMDITAYAIQAENVAFVTEGKYTWVDTLIE